MSGQLTPVPRRLSLLWISRLLIYSIRSVVMRVVASSGKSPTAPALNRIIHILPVPGSMIFESVKGQQTLGILCHAGENATIVPFLSPASTSIFSPHPGSPQRSCHVCSSNVQHVPACASKSLGLNVDPLPNKRPAPATSPPGVGGWR